jgi:hypothetical protein
MAPTIVASVVLPLENEDEGYSCEFLLCIERSAAGADEMLAVELGSSGAAFAARELTSVKVSGHDGSLATLFTQASGFAPTAGDPLTLHLKRSGAALELAVKARIGGGVTTVRL